MQPFQCVWQRRETRMDLRTWQHNMAAFMQPYQCDLQPEIPQAYRTTHTRRTTHCKTLYGGTNHTPKRTARNHLTHELPLPLSLKKHNVSPSGFLPKTSPMQQSCSHYNAFCSIRWQQQNITTIMQPCHCDLQPQVPNTLQLRTHTQTHPNHLEATATLREQKSQNERTRNRPTHFLAALHRRLQALYPKKHNVSRPGFLPQTNPMQHACSHYTPFCSIMWQTRMDLRTWQHNMATQYGNTTWQHSCSHSNAICSHRFQNTLQLRTHKHT